MLPSAETQVQIRFIGGISTPRWALSVPEGRWVMAATKSVKANRHLASALVFRRGALKVPTLRDAEHPKALVNGSRCPVSVASAR
jgi:hypothetical protein